METFKVIFKEGETTGVYGISLVNDPAMESMFIALSKDEIKVELKTVNEEQRIICGAVLIPNKPIYRNQNGKEFFIVFPEETIKLASQNFFKQGYQSSSTLEHNVDAKINDVTIVESWIKTDLEKDKSALYGFNDPIGTWYASMKVDNAEIWDDYIKTGKVKGFSIDGFFDMEKVNLKTEINMSEQAKSLGQEIVDFVKLAFSKKEEKVNLGSIATADNSATFNFDGDTIAIGTVLSMTDANGQQLPVPDGDYTLSDGNVISVMNSAVAEISTQTEESQDVTENEAPANPQTPMSTDAPSVKSEKHTQEVFYQLSKEDMTAMFAEIGKQMDNKFSEFRAEFKKDAEEVVELTRTKPAKEVKYEDMTPLERHRYAKQN